MPTPRPSLASAPLVVLTAASEAYGRCLYQFLLSAERAGLSGDHRFVAADLGLAPTRRRQLESRFGWCEFQRFDFSSHPPHVAPAAQTYAWKPVLIAETLPSAGRLLWLDSATLFHGGLGEVEAQLQHQGVYSLRGQAPLRERCAPRIAAAFGATPRMLARAERVAGVLALDHAHPIAWQIAVRWRDMALDPATIGVRHPGHNPEQALLSLLLNQYAEQGALSLNDDQIDISSATPVRWMSSRNKVPAWLPYWTDPGVRAYYGIAKAVDQFLHRRRQPSAKRTWSTRSA